MDLCISLVKKTKLCIVTIAKDLNALFQTETKSFRFLVLIQARIAQLVAYRLGTGEVPGSNPGKGKNFVVKISN